jgi:hypothetical protein
MLSCVDGRGNSGGSYSAVGCVCGCGTVPGPLLRLISAQERAGVQSTVTVQYNTNENRKFALTLRGNPERKRRKKSGCVGSVVSLSLPPTSYDLRPVSVRQLHAHAARQRSGSKHSKGRLLSTSLVQLCV